MVVRAGNLPKLVVITSPYRELYGPFLGYLAKLAQENPKRPIGVMVTEIVEKKCITFLSDTERPF